MVKVPVFKGSCTAIVTPFNEHGVDYERLKKNLEFQYENGTSAIVVCGTTGENATHTPNEHDELVRVTVRTVNGRMKVIAGIGSNNTENALRAAVAALNTALQNSEGVLAVYGGEDENGIIRYLEIYTDENAFNAAQNSANVKTAAAQALKLAQVHKNLAADAFNLQSKTTGTADKARMALLVIDPAQLGAYKKVLAKEMQSAVANEEGVLALLATTETARPNVFHLLELYADDNAYRAHIDGPYFQEYNKAVQTMVTDKVLIVNKPQAVTLSGKNLK